MPEQEEHIQEESTKEERSLAVNFLQEALLNFIGLHLNMINWSFYKKRMLDRFTRQSQYNKDKGFSHQFTNVSEGMLRHKYDEAGERARRLW